MTLQEVELSLQDYDITLKFLADKFPEHFVNLIFDGFEGEVIPLDKELPSNKRESDYLVKVTDDCAGCDGDKFILHIEFQSSGDSDMPLRMMSYYARIVDKYRLSVYPVVVYLNQDNSGNNITDSYVDSIYDEDIMRFKYRVLKVWEMDPLKIVDKHLYGLFPIIPLIKHDTDGDKKYLASCFDLVQNADIADDVLKADVAICTSILAGLRYPKELIKSLMKVEIMQDSVIYQDIISEGMKKGIAEGKAEGIAEGKAESIISVLSTRFGNVSANLEDMIHHIKNSSRLNELLKLAVTSNTLSEFEQNLQTA